MIRQAKILLFYLILCFTSFFAFAFEAEVKYPKDVLSTDTCSGWLRFIDHMPSSPPSDPPVNLKMQSERLSLDSPRVALFPLTDLISLIYNKTFSRQNRTGPLLEPVGWLLGHPIHPIELTNTGPKYNNVPLLEKLITKAAKKLAKEEFQEQFSEEFLKALQLSEQAMRDRTQGLKELGELEAKFGVTIPLVMPSEPVELGP